MRKLIIPTCSGVYKIVNIKNGKLYVGSAVNLRKRRWEHLCAFRNGRHTKYFQNAFNKYGEKSFIFIIIEFIRDENQLIPQEQT